MYHLVDSHYNYVSVNVKQGKAPKVTPKDTLYKTQLSLMNYTVYTDP